MEKLKKNRTNEIILCIYVKISVRRKRVFRTVTWVNEQIAMPCDQVQDKNRYFSTYLI